MSLTGLFWYVAGSREELRGDEAILAPSLEIAVMTRPARIVQIKNDHMISMFELHYFVVYSV